MEGRYKQFNETLYEENNGPAIAAVLQYIHDQGLYGRLNDDIYGPDIIMYKGYRAVSYVEVEVKRHWGDHTFPFPTVNLPERKGKFLRKRLPIEFWILNSTLDCAVIIPDYAINSSLLNQVPNSQIQSGELFYQIPIEQCNIVSLI